jgi:hypothetical protein
MKTNIENIQRHYAKIPSVWGDWAGAYETMPDEVLYSDGWREVVTPEYDKATQKLGNEWVLIDDVVTKTVIDLTEEEIQAYIDSLCPQTITRRQLRKQLVIDGFDLAVIESMITDPLTLIDWQDSTIFERQNESVISIGTALEIDLNEFFTNASLL